MKPYRTQDVTRIEQHTGLYQELVGKMTAAILEYEEKTGAIFVSASVEEIDATSVSDEHGRYIKRLSVEIERPVAPATW